ncbi:wax ester/triacylglycerol synthase family O-acyltransferase [Prauserella halophila]|uniref:Diacylglycerol O-acyltransferase n=1 Tax=Prauserella halophila TaxID=185641 RepID=A0ABN1W3T2_9PSEU|nr:wax ester/triacylglycerol synthase family O-acyltransferase [Prauserella halophila]MCP2236083.1 acyltransferase, WS/DGAT/MGAT [Prauserella halophila]
MPDRLPAPDAYLLYGEQTSTPMHVGSVAVFERRSGGLDFDTALQVIGQRLDYLPRYRKRLLPVPGHLAPPVWADDVDFDLSYHVRRSALPAPGSDHQLFDLVARLMQRPLDRERPLWEAYYIEGLEGDRVALVTKAHQVLVDGARTVDLAQVLLDAGAGARAQGAAEWTPRRLPAWPQLVADALTGAAARPRDLVENVRFLARDVVSSVGRTAHAAGSLAAAARSATGPAPAAPARRLNSRVSGGRVFAGVRTELDSFKRIRSARDCTVNDVIFTVLTGALRKWLESRGQHVQSTASVRALVPTAVQPEDAEFSPAELTTSRLVPYLIDLPVGEPDPAMRLQHVAHEMDGQFGSDRPVTARAMVKMGGFAPATMNALAARVAGSVPRRGFNVLIANTPGPQDPLYAGPGRLSAIYPVLPLGRDQSLAVGVTSYQGDVYFGLNGDRKAMHDVDVLADMIEESLEELRGNKW